MSRRICIHRYEWRWATVTSLVLVLLAFVPVAAGYAFGHPGLRFSGAVFDRLDYEVHMGAMQLGLRGQWTYEILFTHENHEPKPVKLGYVFLGQVARWAGADSRLVYEGARATLGLLLLLALYRFVAIMDERISVRRLGFIIGAGGSGIGWLYLLVGRVPQPGVSPIDFWHIDAYVFFCMLTFPHIIFVGLLILIIGIQVARFLASGEIRQIVQHSFCKKAIYLSGTHGAQFSSNAI